MSSSPENHESSSEHRLAALPDRQCAGSTAVVEVTPASAGQLPPVSPFQIGPYTVEREIGRGAMGAVYLATHWRLKRKVALKLLSDRIAPSASQLLRFHREMEAVGRVDHPNLVRANDAGEFEGVHYLAMELVDGIDLDRLLGIVGRLSVDAACEIVRQVALGLQHLSDHHLVHRDIKPSNILVTRDGVAKILDLGVAMLREPDQYDYATMDGALMGTPDFMAPEQIEQARDVDIRADIYSLGCTLYSLISGQPPYFGPGYESQVAKLVAHSQETPRPLIDLVPGLSEEIASITSRMMAKRREDRFANPDEVAAAVAPWADADSLKQLLADVRLPEHEGVVSAQPEHAKVVDRSSRSLAKRYYLKLALLMGGLSTAVVFLTSRPTAWDDQQATQTLPTSQVTPRKSDATDESHQEAILAVGSRIADSLADVASHTRGLQTDSKQLTAAADAMHEESRRIADALDSLQASFRAAGTGGSLISSPANLGELYHNAIVQQQQGNLIEARRLYREMFERGADFVDVHQRFQRIVVAQEGLAGARRVYREWGLQEDHAVQQLAVALLCETPQKLTLLQQIAVEHPEFGPAQYEISRCFSVAQLGRQSLSDKVREKQSLAQYLAAHEQGNVLRYYLDQSLAFEALQDAEERIRLLEPITSDSLEHAVTISTARSRAGWHVTFRVAESAQEIRYRLDSQDDFQSTGFLDVRDPTTGDQLPRPTITLPGESNELQLEVQYRNMSGEWCGPFLIHFDPQRERLTDAKRRLEATRVSWARFGTGRTSDRLYLSHLLPFDDLLDKVAYGIDVERPNQTMRLSRLGGEEQRPFLEVPAEAGFVTIQLTFVDGTVTDVVRIGR